MSILNRPGDGNRSVLTVIYKLLLQEGPTDYDKIISLCAPDGVVDPKETRQTLNTWCDLGLLTKNADRVSINQDIKKADRSLHLLPKQAREHVLRSENNQRLWEVEDSKASDFCRATAWLLAQDVYTFDCNSWSEAQPRIHHQMGEDANLIAQNDTRWSGFKDWVTYLGFASNGRFPVSGSLLIDPTNAIRDSLPQVFGEIKTLQADQFLSGLADCLPVVDGGEYRDDLEERLKTATGEHAWHPQPSGQLSTSLSRAILRLESLGILKCENKSDAPVRMILTGRNGSIVGTYSHLTLLSNKI
ncbi:protein DpdG [Coraliomargarita sp. SDUM461003]|uniref:Protein DpdG n=1 Tax=Thalassobacterium maritimum TaxID=3041265 RepID=A0ABU1AR87_9BACT|nr:protein DpdG [Coraliomargarita sp. SDUM461003]MDQ8206667.1 protein DpdG [Coraliomargarita sp. SDUM461003]